MDWHAGGSKLSAEMVLDVNEWLLPARQAKMSCVKRKHDGN
jgi:hypothetical protein